MLAWFFLTPVIYSIGDVMPRATELIGPAAYALFFSNPMAGILTAYRSVLLSADITALHLVIISFAISWVIFVIGIVVFQKAQVHFGDEL